MTNEEAFKQLVKFKNSLLMELRNVGYHPTLDNESPIEFIYIALQALEKQVPKEPKHIETDGFGYCPNCGECAETMGYDAIQFNFCDKCGQRIDWGEEHDTKA